MRASLLIKVGYRDEAVDSGSISVQTYQPNSTRGYYSPIVSAMERLYATL